jgi:hypothetical protein
MPTSTTNRILLSLVVITALAAISISYLAPGFSLDNALVYGGF